MTAQITSYKDFFVYQKSKQLTIDVIKYFGKFKLDRSKEFLLSQLFRAISSVGANIVEGFGRNYSGSFKQFIGISRGSSFETGYWLEILLDLGEFDTKILSEFIERNIEINKMLTGLMKNTKGGSTKY